MRFRCGSGRVVGKATREKNSFTHQMNLDTVLEEPEGGGNRSVATLALISVRSDQTISPSPSPLEQSFWHRCPHEFL